MKRASPHDSERKDRAGPLVLLALIAAAFVPSLFMEFDVQTFKSFSRMSERRIAAPLGSVYLSASEVPVFPDAETEAAFQVSSSPQDGSEAVSRSEAPSLPAPHSPTVAALLWPPGSFAPRAPPLS